MLLLRKKLIFNPAEFPADFRLNTYIRDHAQLPGTKFMCLEGGCGACIVSVRNRHPVTRKYRTRAANSCLTLLHACDGWDIKTTEGIGNRKIGYHPIQKRLADFNGTQCGFCSPGMVMNMYSLLKANDGKLSMEEIENSFSGNLCRCTGYRPILDAMKSFSNESEYEFVDSCKDIEDLTKECPKTGKLCMGTCKSKSVKNFQDNRQWYFPASLEDIFKIFEEIGDKSYKLLAGGTGHGVFRSNFTTEVFIDTNTVKELHTFKQKPDILRLGANITLNEMILIFNDAAKTVGFEYCKKLEEHIGKVANVPVRFMGTLAGNLMLKHQHNEFPSDPFIILTAVGARIYIASDANTVVDMSLPEFLKYDMEKKVILKITLSPINKDENDFESYKIAIRAQNAHAYINAGFLIKYYDGKVSSARLCFGGVRPTFIRASYTENFLKGKDLFVNQTVRDAIETLVTELNPDWTLPDASPEYRTKLACGLFYKFILHLAPSDKINPYYKSGGYILKRLISSGTQTFDTHKENWPLTKPIPKIEGLIQCSGEATFSNDVPSFARQVWAAFVLARKTNVDIALIDPTEALNIPGVVAFYSAKDIPGKNTFTIPALFMLVDEEEIFCSKKVLYHSQPVGVILAETMDLAIQASNKVKITYEHNQRTVVSTLKDVIKEKPLKEVDNCELISGNKRITGRFEIGGQYHFSMEPQTTICVPTENGMTVYCATQWMDLVQISIAEALKMKENTIDVEVKRVGGTYGCKVTRPGFVAVACALACWKLNRPVRFVLDIETNMSVFGKRCACIFDYAMEVDKSGVINIGSIKFKEDMGSSWNDNPVEVFTKPFIPNCYNADGWEVTGEGVLTDSPSNTWCRSPGCLEGIANAENMMEHIARIVNRDPVDVRLDNMPDGIKMKTMLPTFLKSVDYHERKNEIHEFNKVNRWRKRGIAISVMKYPIQFFGTMPATVCIYHKDGTVAISHGGIEVGQGLNTKVIQVAAFILGCPLSFISVKPSNNFVGVNSSPTGGSVGSEQICSAVKKACEILLDRMKPFRDELDNPSWLDVVTKTYENKISLSATHMFRESDLKVYIVWGCSCSEIEVDILTGAFQLNRVDILQDTGESMSPLIDVGQVEGAFTMGIGYWLTEELIYNRRTGKLMNNRSWNYKIPGAKDIPRDFRITLLQKSANATGFLRSKACGELALSLSMSTVFSLRHALDSARKDANVPEKWLPLGAPTTPETVLLAAGHEISDLSLH